MGFVNYQNSVITYDISDCLIIRNLPLESRGGNVDSFDVRVLQKSFLYVIFSNYSVNIKLQVMFRVNQSYLSLCK